MGPALKVGGCYLASSKFVLVSCNIKSVISAASKMIVAPEIMELGLACRP